MSSSSPAPSARPAIFALPLRTLDLLRRHWAQLAFWFLLGYLAHDLVLRGSAWLAHRNQWLGFAGLSVSVLVLLGTLILMFHVLRPSMSTFGAPRRNEPAPLRVEQPRMVDQIAEAILPFLVFYGAWGLFTEEVRTWGVHVINQNFGSGLEVLDITHSVIGIPFAIAVGSWLIRAVLEYFYNRRGGRTLGVATALFEANWMFFAVVSVSVVIGDGIDWLTHRVVWASITDPIGSALGWITGLPGVEQLVSYWPVFKDGMLLPLIWLVIAAVVYGEQMDRDGRIVEGTRLQNRADAAFGKLPTRVQYFSELFSREVRDKWTPLMNGLRLALSAGPVFYLAFCFCYALLEAGTSWAFIGLTNLLGPHPWDWWWPRLEPLNLLEQLSFEVLRVCLLAAAFDLCVSRVRRRRASEVARTPDSRPGSPAPAGAAWPPHPSAPGRR